MRILSGIKPTGRVHLGNFLGAMMSHVELQDKNECFYMIADLHALTIPIKPNDLSKNILELATDMLAAGYDPKKSTLFVQSLVPQHAELMWVFNCITPVSELERMIEYKEMVQRFPKNANAGLLGYPVLQAVDILIYHPDAVPVGRDQAQHLELTNVIARKFNKRFDSSYFDEPQGLIQEMTAKIMSLTEPEKKMSKSLGEASFIGLTDTPDLIRKKLAKAVTDTGPSQGRMSAGVKNLFDLLLIAGNIEDHKRLHARYEEGALQYVDLKSAVADTLASFLRSIRERRKELEKDPAYVQKVFLEGSLHAREVAEKTMKEVREIVGLR